MKNGGGGTCLKEGAGSEGEEVEKTEEVGVLILEGEMNERESCGDTGEENRMGDDSVEKDNRCRGIREEQATEWRLYCSLDSHSDAKWIFFCMFTHVFLILSSACAQKIPRKTY